MATIPWDELKKAAAAAREKAYAPYSKFQVGAAVLFDDGAIVPGANVENSSYGLSVCAERNAIARGVNDGKRKILAVAIVVDSDGPCPPCGACRQVIGEFAGPGAEIRSFDLKGRSSRHTLSELLPHAFGKDFL